MQTEQAKQLLEKLAAVLPEGDPFRDGYTRMLTNIETALPLANTKEKELRLQMDATNAANHAAFAAFRKGVLSEELEKEYRTLKTADEVTKEYETVYQEHKDKENALQEQMKEIQEHNRDMEVFVQVIGGKSEEEAKAQIDQYLQQAAR